jgi:phage tail-like protein
MASPNYPVGFYFKLSFKGEDAAFQEVSGISKEMNIEEVVCGGENRFKYRPPVVASSQNLLLKRSLVPKGSKLLNWCSNCIDLGLTSKIITEDVSVSLLNADTTVFVMWTFHDAYPVKYSVSDLNARESEVVIETIELAYSYYRIWEND